MPNRIASLLNAGPRKRNPAIAALAIALVGVGMAAIAGLAMLHLRQLPPFSPPRTAGPLPHQVYVWQRSWDGRVQSSLEQHAARFEQLIVLAAEVSWNQGRPRIDHAAVDYPAVRATGRPIGLALRIGTFPGPFATNDVTARGLTELAARLIGTARSNDVNIAEFELDFDCAESKLAGYERWVTALRRRLAPVPVTITVLPAWLNRRDFANLARATDGYVLQVHSLDRPTAAGTPAALCDPDAARRWTERAARLAVPFRVALPTYGYRLAFDAAGGFLGLNAEGPERIFPGTQQQRELRADPIALATLVSQWAADRPASLRGLIWYRLPIEGESLNWSWTTLSEVLAGRSPCSELRVVRQTPKPGLFALSLTNSGHADYLGWPVVRAQWSGRRFIAADGLAGFTVNGPSPIATGGGADAEALELAGERPLRLPPGTERAIGWIRIEGNGTVEADLAIAPSPANRKHPE